jgi:hypothetical protein
MSVDDGSLGRGKKKKKKKPVSIDDDSLGRRKKKLVSVDNDSLGQKEEEEFFFFLKEKKRGPVRRGPETSILGPGSQDLGFRTSMHRRTDRQTTSLYK